MNYLAIEEKVRRSFNEKLGYVAVKERLPIGHSSRTHKFDLFERGRLIGGISASPWRNRSGSSNTGGQDRAAAELLWLSLWEGRERRVHVLTDFEMATQTFERFRYGRFPHRITILHYDRRQDSFQKIGVLKP